MHPLGEVAMVGRLRTLSLLTLLALVAVTAMGGTAAFAGGSDRLSKIDHIVVIYQENHSFDNLYGMWEGVRGLRGAPRSRTIQVNQAGTPYQCLLQNDVNLTSPPLSARCTDTTTGTTFTSHFRHGPPTPPRRPPPPATSATGRSPSTTTSRRRTPPARCREGCSPLTASPRARACRAAAPATWSTASTRSSTSSTTAARTGT